MEVTLDSPRISGNSIEYRLHVSRPLRKYFLSDTFYVQYATGVDLRNVDASILAIPMVGLIAPIAWAVGVDVRLNELDATYMQSLGRIKGIYRHLFPTFSFSGDIRAGREVANQFGGNRTGMLFTGGVDSLTSYLRHKQEKPDLFSVWGLPDIPHFQAGFWNTMWKDICTFANAEEVSACQVKTDMIDNMNRELLSREFGLPWFSHALGLFLLGLCAPLTASRRIASVIIASGYTEDYEGPPVSHPLIDNSVAWADVRAVHDGYELSRQQKLQYLCEPDNIRYLSHLRVCWEWVLSRNCGDCEKCFRTIAGLAAEGVDPNKCNFETDETTFPYIIDCFRKGRIALDGGRLFMWRDIRKHIPERIDTNISGSGEFLNWLKGYDLSEHKASGLRKFLWEAHHLYRNRRLNTASIRRKVKCYWYILLAKLGLL